MNEYFCSKCGANRSSEIAAMPERPPCIKCGATALTSNLTIEEAVSAGEHIAAELVPANQVRDWEQRWKNILVDFSMLTQPNMGVMSSEAIHGAWQRLNSFFIHAYHLKDALIDAAPKLGLSKSDIETTISTDSRLALLADLANNDKHLTLTKPPRSGHSPYVEKLSGIDSTIGNGWCLSVKIKHNTQVLDGIEVAHNAINAWREKLNAWAIV